MITKYIKGDITETKLKYIAHGVNCMNVMGSGVAKALYKKWPEVKEQYHVFNNNFSPKELLGMICEVDISMDFTVFNCYTQLDFGGKERHANYAAIAQCFWVIDLMLGESGTKLAIPKIGAGLANGDWEIIEQIINDATPDLEIWVYEL